MCVIGAANCQLITGTPGVNTSHYICADNGWGFVGTLCAGGQDFHGTESFSINGGQTRLCCGTY